MESPGSPSRKRSRDDESPSQRAKREKAAERQRRKRERDRATSITGASPSAVAAATYVLQATAPMPQAPSESYPPTESVSAPPATTQQELTPDEVARRDRVRSSARERQRKHRAIVKQRKMRDLGLDMGNDVVSNIDYTVLPPPPPPPNGQPPPQNGEPPFPQNQPHGGQTFATTLLLSFSCAPLLKQHLLRSLNMTNEELASLEPIIAEAWDHWDQQRRLHYDPQQNAAAYGQQPNFVANSAEASEFRAKFHRSIVVPGDVSPFQQNGSGSPDSSEEAIDPQLGAEDEEQKAE